MKKVQQEKYFITIAAAIVLLVSLSYFAAGFVPPSPLDKSFNITQISVIYINGTTFKPQYVSKYWAYVAENLSQQREGYMNQPSLGDCGGRSPCIGMLFQFHNTSDYCFWMKNTEIPLKQIWIAQNGLVVYTANAAPYSTQNICYIGTSVLETATNSSIVAGDRVLAAV